jgi:hypothetical protein
MKQSPLLIPILLFVIGLLGGWFITDSVVLLEFYTGTYEPICWGGVHIHHLYAGILIAGIGLILWGIGNGKYAWLAILLVGAGTGMFLSDFISHLTWDAPEILC